MNAHPKSLLSESARERTIPAGEFKAKCLKLMDEVAESQQPITITKHGKPIGQLVPMPAEEKPFRSLWGRSPGVKIPDDKEWRRLKEGWAKEWENSLQGSARTLQKDRGRKK